MKGQKEIMKEIRTLTGLRSKATKTAIHVYPTETGAVYNRELISLETIAKRHNLMYYISFVPEGYVSLHR